MAYIVYSNTDYGVEMIAERPTASSEKSLAKQLNRDDPLGSYGYSRIEDEE